MPLEKGRKTLLFSSAAVAIVTIAILLTFDGRETDRTELSPNQVTAGHLDGSRDSATGAESRLNERPHGAANTDPRPWTEVMLRIKDDVADLSEITVEDDVFTRLSTLKRLRVLKMPRNTSDGDLQVIADLPRLEELSLAQCRTHGLGLSRLPRQGRLRVLDLSWSKVNDDDLCSLPYIASIEALQLNGTKISDAGIECLVRMGYVDLGALGLSNNAHITDAAVSELQQMPKLRRLNLYFTAVSDIGLQILSEMKSLEYLACGLTRASRSGIERFRAKRPDVRVDDGG